MVCEKPTQQTSPSPLPLASEVVNGTPHFMHVQCPADHPLRQYLDSSDYYRLPKEGLYHPVWHPVAIPYTRSYKNLLKNMIRSTWPSVMDLVESNATEATWTDQVALMQAITVAMRKKPLGSLSFSRWNRKRCRYISSSSSANRVRMSDHNGPSRSMPIATGKGTVPDCSVPKISRALSMRRSRISSSFSLDTWLGRAG